MRYVCGGQPGGAVERQLESNTLWCTMLCRRTLPLSSGKLRHSRQATMHTLCAKFGVAGLTCVRLALAGLHCDDTAFVGFSVHPCGVCIYNRPAWAA